MRFFLVLVALVGAALAFPPVDTRADCPPAGYTAISGNWKSLDLPAYGKYAICLNTVEFGAINSGLLFNFTWNGVFRLTKSTLLVDRLIRIQAKYPSRLEWNDVTVTGFQGASQPVAASGEWGGITIEGSPSDIPAMYGKYQKDKKFGNCGTLNRVTIGMVDKVEPAYPLSLSNCTSAKLNEIDIIRNSDTGGDQDCVNIEDSKNLIFTDLSVVCQVDGDGVSLERSEAAFVRPLIYSDNDDSFDLEGGSNITVCDSFLYAGSGTHYEVGDEDDSVPSSIAVAGRSNSVFPDELDFDQNGAGGILFTLKNCPEKFSSTYPMKMWQKWYTNTNN